MDDADNATLRIDAFLETALAARPKVVTTRPADGLCRDCREPIADGRQAPTCVSCAAEAEEERKRASRRGW